MRIVDGCSVHPISHKTCLVFEPVGRVSTFWCGDHLYHGEFITMSERTPRVIEVCLITTVTAYTLLWLCVLCRYYLVLQKVSEYNLREIGGTPSCLSPPHLPTWAVGGGSRNVTPILSHCYTMTYSK